MGGLALNLVILSYSKAFIWGRNEPVKNHPKDALYWPTIKWL